MGVKECNRTGCDSIMCNRYSWRYGYICDECFAEMKKSGMDIETFMSTEKYKDRISYDYDVEFPHDGDEENR